MDYVQYFLMLLNYGPLSDQYYRCTVQNESSYSSFLVNVPINAFFKKYGKKIAEILKGSVLYLYKDSV